MNEMKEYARFFSTPFSSKHALHVCSPFPRRQTVVFGERATIKLGMIVVRRNPSFLFAQNFPLRQKPSNQVENFMSYIKSCGPIVRVQVTVLPPSPSPMRHAYPVPAKVVVRRNGEVIRSL